MFDFYPKSIRVYLTVPFNKKDIAKQYSCFWDNEARMWCKRINTFEFDWNDYKLNVSGLVENFNDLFQFNYHHIVFETVFHDEEGFNELLKKSYAIQQTRWLSGETKAEREAQRVKERLKDLEDDEKDAQREARREAYRQSKIKLLTEPDPIKPKPLAIPVRRESVSFLEDPFDD